MSNKLGESIGVCMPMFIAMFIGIVIALLSVDDLTSDGVLRLLIGSITIAILIVGIVHGSRDYSLGGSNSETD